MNSNNSHNETVIGIDVGGVKKGFHAVALKGVAIVDTMTHTSLSEIMEWCKSYQAEVIAVDAPCGWSRDRKSRQAERDLAGKGVSCFSTPMREMAEKNAFYDWVFKGELLYQNLLTHYPNHPLFRGERAEGNYCIETFPHAVVCALKGQVVPAKPKALTRRKVLIDFGLDTDEIKHYLRNIDFVDAALCAVAADYFRKNSYQALGNAVEGYIVIPTGI